MNVFSFTGRLGADCEIKQVGNGNSVTEFRVAVASGYGDREATTWLRCNMWGSRGEAVAPYLVKGQLVAVSGELTNREYEKDGEKRYSLEVRVNDLTLIGGKSDKPAAKPAQQPAAKQSEFVDNDIPF